MSDADSQTRKRPRTEDLSDQETSNGSHTRDNRDSSSAVTPRHSQSQPPLSTFRMEPSIFSKRPEDDLVRQVCDFLWRHIHMNSGANGSHLEIEGKLGVIIDKQTRQRIRLPVLSETAIINDGHYRFDSNMTMNQHAHYNRILNALVERPATKTRYVHTKEMDHFYHRGSQKVRVSVDQKTNQVKEVLTKQRIADMEIYLPGAPLDFRISVNLEVPTQRPSKDTRPNMKRQKDRLSYTHEAFRVDLTQVRQYNEDDHETDLTHEVEVEFVRSADLLSEKEKRARKEPNFFTEYVEVFVNNLRYLSKKAPHNV